MAAVAAGGANPPAMNAQKRLMQDLKKLTNCPTDGITAGPHGADLMKWDAAIAGPEDTPWEGGLYRLTLLFAEEYPHKAPEVRFVTKMFHPNIYADGRLCLDILKTMWSPVYDVGTLLVSIRSLLGDPNPDSPANPEAAAMYRENPVLYRQRVEEIAEKSLED